MSTKALRVDLLNVMTRNGAKTVPRYSSAAFTNVTQNTYHIGKKYTDQATIMKKGLNVSTGNESRKILGDVQRVVNKDYYSIKWSLLRPMQSYFQDKLNRNPCRNTNNFQMSRKASFWSSTETLYDVIGVSKDATTKEIKLAYFQAAKKCHPDLNPNDSAATAKFQKLAEAYEVLSNDQKRKLYDLTGSTGAGQQQQQQPKNSKGYDYQYVYEGAPHQSPTDTFNQVYEDVTMMKDALATIGAEILEDFDLAKEAALDGDFKEVWVIVKSNAAVGGVALCIAVPAVLFLRFPFMLKFAVGAFNFVLLNLARMGRLSWFAQIIWNRLKQISKEKRQRKGRK